MNEQETIADIIAEMNRVEVCADGEPCLRDYARRFEAARKRELDVLNEQIADLRQQRDLWSKRSAELIEKCNEQHAKLKQVGNAAKLREACANIAEYARSAQCHTEDAHVLGYLNQIEGWAKAALAEPVKNCEVGTAEEQAHRFHQFCMARQSPNTGVCVLTCPCCGLPDKCHCMTAWAQMPYEEGGAK